jgi:transposase InsO family protein
LRAEFIYQHRKEWPITLMCQVLQVNRSYYYVVANRLTTAAPDPDQALKKALKRQFAIHRENYGQRRLMKELAAEGLLVGRCKIRRLMKELGLQTRYPKRFKATTDSQHTYKIADNVLNRQFDPMRPNQVWCSDISYLWTNEGWLYLAVVIDLYSRQIVGWSVQDHMRTSLCVDALTMAWWNRKRPQGVLHHSDRGSQYASDDYQQYLQRYGMKCSMSRKGNCWDNAPTERVFRTLKSEWLDRFIFQSKAEAKAAVWEYITYYNAHRQHSVLGYQSPMEFERYRAKAS